MTKEIFLPLMFVFFLALAASTATPKALGHHFPQLPASAGVRKEQSAKHIAVWQTQLHSEVCFPLSSLRDVVLGRSRTGAKIFGASRSRRMPRR